MICPKCKKNSYFLSDIKGKYLKCEKCNYTDLYADPNYDDYHEKRYSYKRKRDCLNDPLLRKIIELKIIDKNSMVLDYGCGAGDYSGFISSRTKNFVGVDINVKKAKERFPGIKFVKISAQEKKLPFPNETFDTIIAVNVIEHVRDFDNLLKEFSRVLKIGGKMFITTYDKDFVLHFIHNDPTHVIEWNILDFKRLLKKYFTVKKCFKYGSFFNYYPFNFLLVKFLKPELCLCVEKLS